MKLQLLKIDKIYEMNDLKFLEMPPGGIQISEGNKTLASRCYLVLEEKDGKFFYVTRDITFDVYYGSEIIPEGEETHSLINILAVEGLIDNIYKKMEEKK